MEQKPCYVYIIECMNESFYTGITIDPERRWKEHRSGTGAKHIRNNKFKEAVFLCRMESISEAMKTEKWIKRMSRDKKIGLIYSGINVFCNNRHKNTCKLARNTGNFRFPFISFS